MLPHRYPFVFVDPPSGLRSDGEEAPSLRIRLTRGAAPVRGRSEWPALLAVEIVAQAAAVLEREDPRADPEPVFLAGCEARFAEALARRPLAAGDELEVTVESRGTFGRLRKVEGRLCRILQGEDSLTEDEDSLTEDLVEVELMLSAS